MGVFVIIMNFSHHDLTLFDRSYPLVSTTSGITIQSGLSEIVTFKIEDPYDIASNLGTSAFSQNTNILANSALGHGGSNDTRLLLVDTLNCPATGRAVIEYVVINSANNRGYSYFPVTITRQISLLTGLYSYWKLDETNGLRYDSVSTNNLYTHVGNSGSYTVGKIGNAYIGYDGVGYRGLEKNNLTHPNDRWSPLSSPSYTDVTLAFWLRNSGNQTGDYTLRTNFYTGADEDKSLDFTIGADLSAFPYPTKSDRFSLGAIGTAPTVSPADSYNVTGWNFFVYWKDQTKIYAQVNNGGINSVSHNINAVYTGVWALISNGESNLYTMDVDELGLWTRTLTPEEKTELYNNGNGITYPF